MDIYFTIIDIPFVYPNFLKNYPIFTLPIQLIYIFQI